MTNCTQESFQFPALNRRIVEANFQGGDITSDGGVLLLQQVDHRLGLCKSVARCLDDPRRRASVKHDSLSLLRQRVYALALGYEDLNDKLYCARGEMENRIKEQQLDLFADRTSCHRWWPNQFRLLLSSLAYMLLEAIRRLALQGTELAVMLPVGNTPLYGSDGWQ